MEAAFYQLSSLSHLTLCNSRYSVRAHCIGGDIPAEAGGYYLFQEFYTALQ
jgi:hypothetical protein